MMYSGNKLQYKLREMDLIAFTRPTPDKLVLTLVEKSEGRKLLPLPGEAVAAIGELLTKESLVTSMTSIVMTEAGLSGWTAEVIIPQPGAVVQPVKDGE